MRWLLFIGGDYTWGSGNAEADKILAKTGSASGEVYLKKLASGLIPQYESVFSLVKPTISWWPLHSPVFRYKGNGIDGNICRPSFLNCFVLKERSIYRNSKKAIKKHFHPSPNDEIDVFVDYEYRPNIKLGGYVKKLFPASKIVVHVQDPIGVNDGHGWLFNSLKKVQGSRTKKALRKNVDGFVLMSPYMEDIANTLKKPSILIEGICDPLETGDEPIIEHSVVYTGVLSESRVNLSALIPAIKIVRQKYPDATIYLAGAGHNPYMEAEENKTYIKYVGSLPADKAKKLQQKAHILVNLRQNAPIFRYSFPSKLTSYLSTGRPIINTRLDCIPEEYGEFVHLLDNLTPENIAKEIMDIFESGPASAEYLDRLKSFIDTKLPTARGKAIRGLFDRLWKDG